MPCTREENKTAQQIAKQQTALQRLRAYLGAGTVSAVIGKNGALAFRGWAAEQREGVSDLCAYRAIANTPEMRRALVKAEAMAGRRLSLIAVAAGVHSHDDGTTWHPGH